MVYVLPTLLALLALTYPATAAEPPVQSSPPGLVSEQNRLAKEFQDLKSAGKLGAAIPVAEKLIEADRRLIAAKPVGPDSEKALAAAKTSLYGVLSWLVEQDEQREDYAGALRRQRDLAGFVEQAFGKDDDRAFEAQQDVAYIEKFQRLKVEDARLLVKVDQTKQQAEGLLTQRKFADAQSLFEDGLQIRQRVLGENHSRTAQSVNGIGACLSWQRQFGQAEEFYRRALAIEAKATPRETPFLALYTLNLGKVLSAQNKTDDAAECYRRAAAIYGRLGVTNAVHRVTAEAAIGYLVRLLQRQAVTATRGEDWDSARKALQKVVDLQTRRFGTQHWQTTNARLAVAHLDRVHSLSPEQRRELTEANATFKLANDAKLTPKPEERLKLTEQCRAIYEKLMGPEAPETVTAITQLAIIHSGQRADPQAEPLYQKALEIRKKVLGENHPDYANSLISLANLYDARFYSARAEPLYRQASEIRKKALGENSPVYAKSLNDLALLYHHRGDYARAEPLLRQASEIRKKALGENSPVYAKSLNDLALVYFRPGNYARAESILCKAIAVLKKALGENHPDYATSLKDLAFLYELQRDYTQAETVYRQVIEIRRKAVGESHPDYASSLEELARMYKAQGAYARAETVYRQVIEVRKKAMGENHPDYAASLSSLGRLFWDQWDYPRAELLMRQAVEARKKALGENRFDYPYVVYLRQLGMLYKGQGDYERAESILRQALEIRGSLFGTKDFYYLWAKNDLAKLYLEQGDIARTELLGRQTLDARKNEVRFPNKQTYSESLCTMADIELAQGDYARAEALAQEASELTKRDSGTRNFGYARSLQSLADVKSAQGDFIRAESLYQTAANIWHDTPLFGPDSSEYAEAINRLAETCAAQGDYSRAEVFCKRALETCKKIHGTGHPDYSRSLNTLAGVYMAQGDYPRAEPLYRQVLEIRKKALGENHPDYARGLNRMAELYQHQGDYARAERLFRQSASIIRNHLEATAVVQSERQQLAMLQSVRFYLDNYLALTTGQDQFTASAYQQMLAWKGIVFRRERLARAGEQTPELMAIFRKLQQVAGQLAKQAWATPDLQQEVHWRENIQRLSAEKERLEAELSDRSAAYRQAKKQVTLEELQQALPKEAVLVDILQYNHYTPADEKAGTTWSWHPRLIAFVVRHDGPVVRINIGPEQRVSEAIDAWRVTFGMSPPAAAAGRLLRQTLWEPIEAQLAGAKIVLVSPDGVISRLPLGALPGKEPGSYLMEERTLAIVPVAQMIPQIVQEEGRKDLTKNLLLLGNINYDAQRDQAATVPAATKKFGRGLPEGFAPFNRLPGTQGEVASIEKLYRHDFGAEGILSLEEGRATKTAFLAEAGKYRYVHLATHGFFVEEKLPVSVSLAQRGSERFGEMLRGPEATAGHVGLLCGLALAGANRGGVATTDTDDGILTAEEIGAQNLDGVQMVMLSACETGLGKVAGGEGLLGLQRSFQAAGARTVVASLWQVPDTATRDLMEHFYENHWEKNMGVLPALREAQLTMLREGRQRGVVRDDEPSPAVDPKRAPPYYWAAFVLSGDWR